MWILTLLKPLIASWMAVYVSLSIPWKNSLVNMYRNVLECHIYIKIFEITIIFKLEIQNHPRRNQWLQQSQDPHHCLEGNTEELNGTLYNLMKLLPEPVVALIHPPVLTDISVAIFDVQKSCSEMKNHGNWNLKSSRARSMQRLWNKLCNSSVTRKSFKLAT